MLFLQCSSGIYIYCLYFRLMHGDIDSALISYILHDFPIYLQLLQTVSFSLPCPRTRSGFVFQVQSNIEGFVEGVLGGRCITAHIRDCVCKLAGYSGMPRNIQYNNNKLRGEPEVYQRFCNNACVSLNSHFPFSIIFINCQFSKSSKKPAMRNCNACSVSQEDFVSFCAVLKIYLCQNSNVLT